MINLIPPQAKRKVTEEYWLRVATVWLFLVALAGFVTICLALPSYFLVHTINRSLVGQSDQIKEQQAAFTEAEAMVKDVNALINKVSVDGSDTRFTTLLAALDKVAGSDVTLSQVVVSPAIEGEPNIKLAGIAKTRSALSNFTQSLNEHELFSNAELPIANLAKEKDITFSLTVTIEATANTL